MFVCMYTYIYANIAIVAELQPSLLILNEKYTIL